MIQETYEDIVNKWYDKRHPDPYIWAPLLLIN